MLYIKVYVHTDSTVFVLQILCNDPPIERWTRQVWEDSNECYCDGPLKNVMNCSAYVKKENCWWIGVSSVKPTSCFLINFLLVTCEEHGNASYTLILHVNASRVGEGVSEFGLQFELH